MLDEINAITAIIKNVVHTIFLIISIAALIIGYFQRQKLTNWAKRTFK